jgi:Holliday junction DNA helicase RuvB
MTILNNVIGQRRAKQMLCLLGQSFNRRKKLPSIGIFGPSGLGKTHLVSEFSDWLGAKLIYINGTAIKDALAFRSYIKEAGKQSDKYHIIFVDECHNLPRKVQENLLSVLEDPAVLCTIAPKEVGNVRCVDGIRFIDKGDVMREALPQNLSFIFATTDPVMLKETVLNRLRKIHLEPYTLEEKAEIAMGHLVNNGVRSDTALYVALAGRARSIRHLKDDLCETFIDIDQLFDESEMSDKLYRMDEMLGTDEDGATYQDIDYMDYLASHKIAGVDTLAGVLKTDKKDVVHRIEPFLIEKGWITITGKGRILTALGRKKMLGEDGEDVDALTAE